MKCTAMTVSQFNRHVQVGTKVLYRVTGEKTKTTSEAFEEGGKVRVEIEGGRVAKISKLETIGDECEYKFAEAIK